ncbi:MAG: hypothetical protein KKA73_24525 [Chloroflexi bacterium]|nr:hypothetical protein [Chloroflexota bacterium]MBU1750860.1 hypothetical protein [Chloroflexota bacterium]
MQARNTHQRAPHAPAARLRYARPSAVSLAAVATAAGVGATDCQAGGGYITNCKNGSWADPACRDGGYAGYGCANGGSE